MINFIISPIAITQIKNQLVNRKTPNAYLRLGVRGAGCNGFSYDILWDDNEPRPKDLIFDFDGAKVVIDNKSILYLDGATLDWEQNLIKTGFKFINPLESSRCGCGASISFKEKL